MDISTRWWLRRCLKCQARKISRQTIRWPTFSLPLPNGPCILVSVDYLGPPPLTPRGNAYILLYTDRFSRRADMYTTAEAQFTAPGTADILVDRYIPLWGCTVTLLYDNGLRFCANFPSPSTTASASTILPPALPPMHQRRYRACHPHHGPHARHGRRRATNGLGYSTPTRRELVQNSVSAATRLLSPP